MPEYKYRYYPYADLYSGNLRFLKLIDENKKGGLVYSLCISVIVFSAFCLEGYMNHIGPTYFQTWFDEETGEIWKRPKEKLCLICDKVNITPDFGRRPFQSFSQIFRFRNLIAHAKTMTLEGSFSGEYPITKAEIEKTAIPKNAYMFHKDSEEIIWTIHKVYNPNEHPFLITGESEWQE
jgi:hypothetical protein